jgi:hypothetical protein
MGNNIPNQVQNQFIPIIGRIPARLNKQINTERLFQSIMNAIENVCQTFDINPTLAFELITDILHI